MYFLVVRNPRSVLPEVQGLLQTAGQTPQTLSSQGDSFSVLLKDVPMYRLRQLAAELQPAARGHGERSRS